MQGQIVLDWLGQSPELEGAGMSRRSRRIAALAVCAVIGVMVIPATSSAEPPGLAFKNWAVWGSLTDKKLNESINLPKGSTFNGFAEFLTISSTEFTAKVTGTIAVPPFTAMLKLAGAVPTEVGVTFTQVGESEGSIVTVPRTSTCEHAQVPGFCVKLTVNSKATLGLTETGLLGIKVPTHCETSEPLSLELTYTTTLGDLIGVGPHFTGTTTIPPFKCEGLQGAVLGPLVTALISGPENPYSLHLFEHEPKAPTVATKLALGVSQISAHVNATVYPEGEPVTDCHFEVGTTNKYGTSVPCISPPLSTFAVHANLEGLSEETTYHYRVVATNSIGTSIGADETFTTPGKAPEYGQCVAQKEGEYADDTCNTKAKKAKKGKFEWRPGPAPTCVAQKRGEYTDSSCTTKSAKPKRGTYEKAPGPGYTATIEPTTVEVSALGKTLQCAGGTAAGEVTGVSTGVDRITLTGCEISGKQCASEGTNGTASGEPGVIVTNLLRTRLLGPIAHASYNVWVQLLSGEHEPYLAEFGCEGERFRITGSISGVHRGDLGTPNASSRTEFSPEEGDQPLYVEGSNNGGQSWVGPDLATVVMSASNQSATPIEIKP
jgi:hypothetical protein